LMRKRQYSMQVVKDALSLAHGATEITAETQDIARETLELAENVLKELGRAATISEILLKYLDDKQPLPSDVLTPEELAIAAELYPEWSISTGFSRGRATKTYTRNLSDL